MASWQKGLSIFLLLTLIISFAFAKTQKKIPLQQIQTLVDQFSKVLFFFPQNQQKEVPFICPAPILPDSIKVTMKDTSQVYVKKEIQNES